MLIAKARRATTWRVVTDRWWGLWVGFSGPSSLSKVVKCIGRSIMIDKRGYLMVPFQSSRLLLCR